MGNVMLDYVSSQTTLGVQDLFDYDTLVVDLKSSCMKVRELFFWNLATNYYKLIVWNSPE